MVEEVAHGRFDLGVVDGVVGVVVELFQEGRRLGQRAQFQQVQKVQVAQSFRALAVRRFRIEPDPMTSSNNPNQG